MTCTRLKSLHYKYTCVPWRNCIVVLAGQIRSQPCLLLRLSALARIITPSRIYYGDHFGVIEEQMSLRITPGTAI
jgi:hypothetical protein